MHDRYAIVPPRGQNGIVNVFVSIAMFLVVVQSDKLHKQDGLGALCSCGVVMLYAMFDDDM